MEGICRWLRFLWRNANTLYLRPEKDDDMEWSAFEQYDGLTDMAARKEKLECESAREYYFSLLFPSEGEAVPEKIRRHVERCIRCSERLNQMKSLLAGLVQFGVDKQYYIRQLVRHFSLVKTEVDCEQVKKLLPLLADGKFNIPVPTPVTVHVDQCPQCVHDLQTLRSLCLSSRQLARLGDFYAAESFEGSAGCAKIERFVADVARMHLERVERAVLDHICLCRKCRRLLYDERLRLKGEIAGAQTEIIPLPCGSIEQIDLYDYVVPFGLEEGADKYVRNRDALAEHLRQCPACLEKMRQLHNIVYTIDNRANSGVTTWYELSPAEVRHGFEDASAEYADFPLNIQVSKRTRRLPIPTIAAEVAETPTLAPKPRKKRRLANYARPIGIAATIMLIASFLFIATPKTQAVALAQVYQAIERVRNVCISQYFQEQGEPQKRVWTSKSQGIRVDWTKDQTILSDTVNGVRKIKRRGESDVHISDIKGELIEGLAKGIEQGGGIMPFEELSSVPDNADWRQVEDATFGAKIPNAELYELTWLKQDGGQARWRAYIEKGTNLPRMVDVYIAYPGERDPRLTFRTIIEYPTDEEFDAFVQDIFF